MTLAALYILTAHPFFNISQQLQHQEKEYKGTSVQDGGEKNQQLEASSESITHRAAAAAATELYTYSKTLSCAQPSARRRIPPHDRIHLGRKNSRTPPSPLSCFLLSIVHFLPRQTYRSRSIFIMPFLSLLLSSPCLSPPIDLSIPTLLLCTHTHTHIHTCERLLWRFGSLC